MWVYEIRTGRMYKDGSAVVVGIGWAGQGAGKNNPDMQGVENIGPLPVGFYTFTEPYDNPKTGPYTMNLIPDPKNNMLGRKDFRIHGAAFVNPELSSEGCIIQPRSVRSMLWNSGDHGLQAVVDYDRLD